MIHLYAQLDGVNMTNLHFRSWFQVARLFCSHSDTGSDRHQEIERALLTRLLNGELIFCPFTEYLIPHYVMFLDWRNDPLSLSIQRDGIRYASIDPSIHVATQPKLIQRTWKKLSHRQFWNALRITSAARSSFLSTRLKVSHSHDSATWAVRSREPEVLELRT